MLGFGVLLQVVAETTPWVLPTSHLALFSVLSGAAVLAGTFVASLLPSNMKRLGECQR
jgi:hypothetical protein